MLKATPYHAQRLSLVKAVLPDYQGAGGSLLAALTSTPDLFPAAASTGVLKVLDGQFSDAADLLGLFIDDPGKVGLLKTWLTVARFSDRPEATASRALAETLLELPAPQSLDALKAFWQPGLTDPDVGHLATAIAATLPHLADPKPFLLAAQHQLLEVADAYHDTTMARPLIATLSTDPQRALSALSKLKGDVYRAAVSVQQSHASGIQEDGDGLQIGGLKL